MSGGHAIGWKLDRAERDVLLARFRPEYENVVADHVTLKSGVGKSARLPPRRGAEIVGCAARDGIEAMVVRIDGTCDRPGGGTFHITWSLGPGREARESNDLLASGDWDLLEIPVPIALEPARFP